MNLLKNTSIRMVKVPIANASNTDANTTIIDMAGWDGVAFIAQITDSAATGVATLKVEGNTANQDAGMVALTGASAAATCATNDDINDKLLIIDVNKPLKRYIQGVLTSATANIAFGHTIAILYQGNKLPTDIDTTVLASALVVGA